MIAIIVLNELSKEVTTLGFSPSYAVVLGLITGELTKYLNTKNSSL